MATQLLIRIGLVEVNGLKRDSLVCALQHHEDIRVCFAYEDANEIPADASEIDVLLLCAVYPTEIFGEGLTLDYWQLRFPSTKFILLATYCVRNTLHQLIDEGLHGCAIQDRVSVSDLVNLIHRVLEQQPAFCPQAALMYASKPLTNIRLTFMEQRILWLLREVGTGYGRGKDCAARLGMARSTFRVHTKNICGKLDVSTIQEILPRAFALGLIEATPISL